MRVGEYKYYEYESIITSNSYFKYFKFDHKGTLLARDSF